MLSPDFSVCLPSSLQPNYHLTSAQRSETCLLILRVGRALEPEKLSGGALGSGRLVRGGAGVDFGVEDDTLRANLQVGLS